MRKKWARQMIVVFLGLVLALAGCQPAPPEAGESEREVEENEEPRYLCDLTGRWLEHEEAASRRPLAVVLDNSPRARPQAGLDQADWVFEIPVEGGITRLLGVYRTQLPAEVGPVRSLRPYFLDRVLEFGAAVAHVGYSPRARDQLPGLPVTSLNEFTYEELFWRDAEKPRPHNVFTDLEALHSQLDRAEGEEYSAGGAPGFLAEGEAARGGRVEAVHIHHRTGTVSYHYREGEEAFYRHLNGEPQVSASGEGIRADTVIIQQVGAPRIIDDQGRLDLAFTGSGRAKYLRYGRMQEGEWQKQARQDWTQWLDRNGNAVELAPGRIWVQVVPPGVEVTVDWREDED